MLVYINTVLWILLIISLVIGLTRKQDKLIIKTMIYSRILYLILLIGEVVFTLNHFSAHPYLVTANFVFTIIAVSFVDICYQRKIQGNLKTYIILLTFLSIVISIGLLYTIR